MGFDASLRLRTLSTYMSISGIHQGEVKGHSVLDLVARYTFRNSGLSLTLNVQNFLNNRHIEWAGTAEIGRLATLQLGYSR